MKKTKRGKVPVIVLLLICLIAIGITDYFFWQYQLQRQLNTIYRNRNNRTTFGETLPQQEIANWETYTNEKYGFTLKYPPELSINLNNRGFISGSDYYGKRDFNFLITNPHKEPRERRFIDDDSTRPSVEYDGYNFAIFSGESAVKHLSNEQALIKNGTTYSPPIQKEFVNISGKKYPLYYIPPSNLPNTDKTSFWFTHFPIHNSTIIVTGNYDQEILKKILSTFKFTS